MKGNADVVSGKRPELSDEAVLRRDEQMLHEMASGFGEQFGGLVRQAYQRGLLAGELRVLEVTRRLVDEREQAARRDAEARQRMVELQARLDRVQVEKQALMAQISLVNAITSFPLVAGTTSRTSPERPLLLSANKKKQVLLVARYRDAHPWRADLMGRPYRISTSEALSSLP